MHALHGVLMPRMFGAEKFESALEYEGRPSDIFVASYPKCGTTWVMNIVYLILHDGKPLDGTLPSVFPFLEARGGESIGTTGCDHRLAKTHLHYDMLNLTKGGKILYVARNPKDCLVSFYHFSKSFEEFHFADASFDVFFDLFLNGRVFFNDYFDHLRSWLPHATDSNVCFLTYEQMIDNPRDAILQIASFLDHDLYPDRLLANDEYVLKSIIQQSSFTTMSSDQWKWCPKKMLPGSSFIRRGIVGDWKNYFSQEQDALMNKKIMENLTPTELGTIWTEKQLIGFNMSDSTSDDFSHVVA